MPKELGKLANLKTFTVYNNKLEGQLSIRTERLRISMTAFTFVSGELPLEIIRMKAKGIIPHDTPSTYSGLDGNKGFTLPANIGELGGDIKELNLARCSLTGPLSIRAERIISTTEIGAVFLQGLCRRFSLLRSRFLI